MEMSLYLALLIISIIALALILLFTKIEDEDLSKVLLTIIFSCLALGSLLSIINYNEPTALDVYQGKTTLEITYRDSVAIDSTVVYKVK
jgi:hypothetical protein